MIQGELVRFMDFGNGYFHRGEQLWFDGTDLELGEALASGTIKVQFDDGIDRELPSDAVYFVEY